MYELSNAITMLPYLEFGNYGLVACSMVYHIAKAFKHKSAYFFLKCDCISQVLFLLDLTKKYYWRGYLSILMIIFSKNPRLYACMMHMVHVYNSKYVKSNHCFYLACIVYILDELGLKIWPLGHIFLFYYTKLYILKK